LTASQKGDSEGELQEQTPDTDDSGAHSYTDGSANATGAFPAPNSTLSSFKRQPAPVMGNRGLEQRGKKSRTYPPKDAAAAQKVRLVNLVVRYHLFFSGSLRISNTRKNWKTSSDRKKTTRDFTSL